MSYAIARGTFYADGLRWIALLLTSAAERLERNAVSQVPLEQAPRRAVHDEALYELRNRLANTW